MRISKIMKEQIVGKVMEIKFPQTKCDQLKRDIAEFIRANTSFPIIPKELADYVSTSSTIDLKVIYGDGTYDYNVHSLNVKMYPSKGSYTDYGVYIDSKKNKRNTSAIKAPNGTKKLYDKWQKHLSKKNDFEDMLKSSLLSINTKKQLKNNLPELEKFLPNENCSGLVPVESFKAVRKELKGL
jgi:hypothetical protein